MRKEFPRGKRNFLSHPKTIMLALQSSGLGRWPGCALLAATLFLGTAIGGAASAADLPFQSQFSPSFPTIDQLKFGTLAGGELKGEDLLGQAVVIVFFEPECGGCVKKLPTFEKIRSTFKSDGVTFIGMSSSGGGIASAAKRVGYDWVWATNSTSLRPKLEAHRAFEIFLFDRSGTILYRIPIDDKDWDLHLAAGLGAVLGRSLDFSEVPQNFVGSQVCGMCHAAELTHWEGTAHAHAYQTMSASNQGGKAECVSCHVTGERGVEKREWRDTPEKHREVGCEECHGPGGPHRKQAFSQADLYSYQEQSCKRCHEPLVAECSTSWEEPKWDFATALQAISHRGTVAVPEGSIPRVRIQN
jgi:thiol-disulfide isomerase/thioredoxin